MFLDIDHVAISSININKHVDFFSSLGYKTQFYEKNLFNLKIKKQLLDYSSLKHDICLLKKPRNLGIEIINHGKIRDVNPYILPIFQNLPDRFNAIEGIDVENIGHKLTLQEIPLDIIGKNTKQSFIFNQLYFKTHDMEQSIDFWKNFGFTIISSSKKYSLLKYSSILTNSEYFFHLGLEKKSILHFLNDAGCNAIAFFSNSLQNDLDMLSLNNIKTSKIEELEVNKKILKISFCTGPAGELVEIFSF